MNSGSARFIGIFGLVVFLFGIIGGFVTSFEIPLVLGHVIVGAISLLVWFAIIGARNLGNTSNVITGRTSRYGANVVLYTTVFVALLVGINWLGNRPSYIKRWDLTEQKLHSLSDQSIKVLEKLDHPLRIVAFIGKNLGSPAHELVDLYSYYSQKVKVEFVDPTTKPHLIEKYKMKEGNLLYLAYGEEDKVIGDSRLNDLREESITNAIIKLTRGAAKTIYYVTGHDEPSLTDDSKFGTKMLADAVGDEHLTIAPLFLAEKAVVPADAAAVMVVAPKKPMLPEERSMLINYAEAGGRLILMADPSFPAGPDDIAQIAAHFKIKVGNDMVLDQVRRLFAGPAIGAQPIVTTYASTGPSAGLTDQQPTVFNMASSVTTTEKSSPTESWTEVIKSSPTAWAETDLAGLLGSDEPRAERGDADVGGPVSMAITYEKKLGASPADPNASAAPSEEKVARVVVYGDADWILNVNFNFYANRDLVLNTVNWVVGEEGGVTIRPKTQQSMNQMIERGTLLNILVSGFIIPEILLVMGLAIWWRRRTIYA
jgi:ABC-type uncharacterized transport system involved in gliding motility auxiliary subunit